MMCTAADLATEWEQIQQSREAAMEKCWSACETGDLNRFNNCIQEFFGQLGDDNVGMLLRRIFKKGWVEGARSLLQQGADLKLISLTMLARDCRSVDILKLLAEYGLDYTSGQANILVWVLDRLDILDFLLDQGIDINGGSDDFTMYGRDKSYYDHTVAVLNKAAYRGDIELFDQLVARGAQPSRSIALHEAACSQNATAMITHLIEKYAFDVNADDGCGGLNELVRHWRVTPRFPLGYAASRSNLPAIETLLKYGAQIRDSWSYTITDQNASALKLLLDAGADASESLGVAITKDYLEGARLCLEYGGDIAVGEARDEFVAGFGGKYTGMSTEMRKLLDEWKIIRSEAQNSQET